MKMIMKNKHVLLFVIGMIFSTSFLSSCCPPICFPPETTDWREYSYDTLIPLGFKENNFEIYKDIYVGHDVERFKMKFRVDPNTWIAALKIYIYRGNSGSGGLIQTIDALPANTVDGDFVTAEIPGGAARIIITSDGHFVSVGDPAGGYLYIKSVFIKRDAAIPSNYVPPSTQTLDQLMAQGRVMSASGEVNGFLAGGLKTHYYALRLVPGEVVSIYVSPLCLGTGNDSGLSLYIDTNWFIYPSETTSSPNKIIAARGDTGIYYELGPYNVDTSFYLSVHDVIGCSYTISATDIVKKFNIVFEMSNGLKDQEAPALDQDFYAGTINFINLDGWSHRRYLQFYGTVKYLRRLKEVIVLSSADMLAASEGQLRIKRADIYESEHTFLNTDVFVHQTYGRAYASLTKINIYKDELDEPVQGGATLHHEWGHFEYGMDDEYRDKESGVEIIDPNSVMGTSGDYNNVPAFEFCTSLNHQWVDNWDPSLADDESNFDILYDQYWGLVAPRYPSNQGRYHDILHKLESYIKFNYYE